jgi:DNA-binding SARP family transcriptional activator
MSRMSTLSVRALGDFGVRLDGAWIRPDFWDKRRASILLQMLVAAPGYRLPSDVLADRLWPDSTTNQAKVNLAGRIAELRSVFVAAPSPLLVHSGFVGIDPSFGPDVDAARFELAASAALNAPVEAEGWAERALAALDIWTGDYLPALDSDDVFALRRRFARLRIALALRLLDEADGSPAVRAAAAGVFATAQHDESLTYALIDSLLRHGETDRAVDAFGRHAATLGRSNLRPAPRLGLRIGPFLRSGLEPARSRATDDEIVGRDAEVAAIDDAVAALAKRSLGAVELVGAPGSGRSRLFHALIERASAAGVVVGSARGTLHDSAQVVLHDLVRSLTSELTFTERQRRRLMPPNTIVAFGALDASIDALVNAARWRASRGPVLLALDDAGRVDAAVLRSVVETLGNDRDLPVAFAFVRDSAQPQILSGARTIAVAALDAAASRAVLQCNRPDMDGLDDDAWDAIVAFWPGNLRYQLAIADETARLGEVDPCLPASLRIDVRLRYEALSPEAREAIDADGPLKAGVGDELERAGLLADAAGTRVIPDAVRRIAASGDL